MKGNCRKKNLTTCERKTSSYKPAFIKNGVFPVTILFFWEFCLSLIPSYEDLIWFTNYPKAHIYTFCKRWSFIWRCFFSDSILKLRHEVLKFTDIYVTWTSSKTDLETNFLSFQNQSFVQVIFLNINFAVNIWHYLLTYLFL